MDLLVLFFFSLGTDDLFYPFFTLDRTVVSIPLSGPVSYFFYPSYEERLPQAPRRSFPTRPGGTPTGAQ